MQTDLLHEDQKSLIVRSEPIELVLSEDGVARLAIVLPPFEDLREIEQLSKTHFSLKEHADKEWEPFKAAFAAELELLGRKRERFSGSKTYFTHLANLAELAGDRETEFKVLNHAQAASSDAFFKHRLGENLQALGRIREAEDIFSTFDLKSNASANLRIAYFHAQRNDLELAARSVSQALAIDPLNYGGRLFEGGLRLARGQFYEAIQSFRIAEAERPTSSILFTNVAIAYICIKNNDKALIALRKAVALDPLNHNAISMLADVAHSSGHDEDAVPALRYFVSLEQKMPSIWGRLARSLLQLKRSDEALSALRRQASLEDTSGVWNNIGVAHSTGGNKKGALSAFKHAMTKVSSESVRDAFLALRNILTMLVQEGNFDAVVRMARLGIREDRNGLIKSDKKLADIYTSFIYSMKQLNKVEEALMLSEDLLRDPSISVTLRVWVVAQLLAYYSIAPNMTEKALLLARNYRSILDSPIDIDRPLLEHLVNNLTFAFAEAGLIEEAKALLPYLGKLAHKQAFPTATLGLIHMRKGNIDKAEVLYEEAIRLSVKQEDKRRIRQKLNLELGMYWMYTDADRAQRLLKKAADERVSLPELALKAKTLLLSIRHKH